MADVTMQQVLDQLASLHDRLARQEAALARYRRRPRPIAIAAVALFVALVPLGVLAAVPFTDLTGGVHDPNIGAIYEAGVTRGCAPDQEYCPTANVTREEMASFLARLGGLGGNPPVANARTAQAAASADTAANAAQLGGVPAAAFARAETFERGFFFAVQGSGGQFATPAQYRANGGHFLIIASGTGYRSSAGTLGINVRVEAIDEPGNGTTLALVGFTNEAQSHRALPTQVGYLATTPDRLYRVKVTVGSGTVVNDADWLNIALVGLP